MAFGSSLRCHYFIGEFNCIFISISTLLTPAYHYPKPTPLRQGRKNSQLYSYGYGGDSVVGIYPSSCVLFFIACGFAHDKRKSVALTVPSAVHFLLYSFSWTSSYGSCLPMLPLPFNFCSFNISLMLSSLEYPLSLPFVVQVTIHCSTYDPSCLNEPFILLCASRLTDRHAGLQQRNGLFRRDQPYQYNGSLCILISHDIKLNFAVVPPFLVPQLKNISRSSKNDVHLVI